MPRTPLCAWSHVFGQGTYHCQTEQQGNSPFCRFHQEFPGRVKCRLCNAPARREANSTAIPDFCELHHDMPRMGEPTPRAGVVPTTETPRTRAEASLVSEMARMLMGPNILSSLEEWSAIDVNVEQMEGENMPRVAFSQVATPYVAALVERLGGDITVPQADLPAGFNLSWSRIAEGLRFRIANRDGEIYRSINAVHRAELPTVNAETTWPERRAEVVIEKFRDEEEFELGKRLMTCAECGLKSEKTHRRPDGTEECPYCEIRKLERIDLASEIAALKLQLNASQAQRDDLFSKATRLEGMVQEKIGLVTEKSSEIKRLRQLLENRGTSTAEPEERVSPGMAAEVRRIREANPRLSLADAMVEARRHRPAVAPTPHPRTIREAVAELAGRYNGTLVSHHHQTHHTGPMGVQGAEVHTFELAVPLQSHISEEPPRIRRDSSGGWQPF